MVTPGTKALIEAAIEEDLGRGDVTSEAVLPPGATARGTIVAKQQLVLAGLDVAELVFHRVDPYLIVQRAASDGDELQKGATIATVAGDARGLLAAERTALNFLQRLSGIATLTRAFVRAIEGTKATIVDTRKTAPGWRLLDKAAVRAGGAANHRADLASGILIKDNHIAACGSVGEAVKRARKNAPHGLKVEVEVSTMGALDEALAAGAEIVLLDNVSPASAAELVARVNGCALVEVSGNMRLDTVRAYAEAGVDLISAGAITHSAPAADLSLEVELQVGSG
jgi:nicotinate-nucleotide pyrophosphorylase (carboxylating)